MLQAVVFDFDGVIVDSEPLHFQAFMKVLAPFDISCTWQDYCDLYMGFDDRDGFRAFFQSAGHHLEDVLLKELIAAKAAAFQEVVAAGIEPFPGVIALIRALEPIVPLALCSGALHSDIDPVLKSLGIKDAFSVMVTAEEVQVSKPDPESYQLALARLQKAYPSSGISGATAVAIEDTPAGIASARGAGLTVLGVATSYPRKRLESMGIRVVASLEEVTTVALAKLLNG